MTPPDGRAQQLSHSRSQSQLVSYGGQWFTAEDAGRAKQRDLRLHGAQYVDAMHRMMPVNGRNGGLNSPPGSSGNEQQQQQAVTGQAGSGRKWI